MSILIVINLTESDFVIFNCPVYLLLVKNGLIDLSKHIPSIIHSSNHSNKSCKQRRPTLCFDSSLQIIYHF